MEEDLTVDKEYLRAFNQGYALAKETGLKPGLLDKLKPEKLDKIGINKSRLNVIKLGMQQYEFDNKPPLEKKEDKSKISKQTIIPPFDMDSVHKENIHTNPNKNKTKDKGKDIDL